MEKQNEKDEIVIASGEEARESFRNFLVKHSHCKLQGGIVKGEKKDYGWPCGTCFMDLLNRMGLDDKDEQYNEANRPRERHNEVWRAVLQMRDANLRK